jgi:iron complex transport system ATP-binding protein
MALAAGELVAIVGPNGSGKSTLGRAVLGTVPLEQGQVELLGRPLATWSRREVAGAVGVLVQQEPAPLNVSVEDVVMFGRYARLGPLATPGPADRAAVERALTRSDTLELRHRPAAHVSGGEWQRARIARALAQEPRILVLDEPGAGLDVRHEMELFELVRALVRDGLGGLVITHNLNLAARYADRLLLLDRGRLVAHGAPREVLQQDLVTRVFHWPVAITTWCDGSPQVVPLRPGDAHTTTAGTP